MTCKFQKWNSIFRNKVLKATKLQRRGEYVTAVKNMTLVVNKNNNENSEEDKKILFGIHQ